MNQPAPTVPLEQVEWRVDSKPYDRSGQQVCRYVPHLNAATAARLLDEWVGPDNWSDDYELAQVDGKTALWCHLSVRLNDEWVTKKDLGVPSNMEAQKGLVSDAFKRATILKWGVGRNVYELPTLYAPCRVDNKGNARPNDDTLPSILRQLEAAGFNADGGRLEGEDDTDVGGEQGVPEQKEGDGTDRSNLSRGDKQEPAPTDPTPHPEPDSEDDDAARRRRYFATLGDLASDNIDNPGHAGDWKDLAHTIVKRQYQVDSYHDIPTDALDTFLSYLESGEKGVRERFVGKVNDEWDARQKAAAEEADDGTDPDWPEDNDKVAKVREELRAKFGAPPGDAA